jgi:hypothetical protein
MSNDNNDMITLGNQCRQRIKVVERDRDCAYLRSELVPVQSYRMLALVVCVRISVS